MPQDDVARREFLVYTSLAAKALSDEQFDRSLRYALQAYPGQGNISWLTPFPTELEGKLAGAAQSTRLYRPLKGHTRTVTSAAFSPDGKRVVTASGDDTARLWDAESGKEIAVLKGHTGPVSSAAFRPDGKRVVTASFDNARLWDAESGKEIAVLKGHTRSRHQSLSRLEPPAYNRGIDRDPTDTNHPEGDRYRYQPFPGWGFARVQR
jgi:WD40 repeat protein